MIAKFKKILVDQLKISPSDFDKAHELSKSKGLLLPHAFEELGIGNVNHILAAYSKVYNIQIANLDEMDIPDKILSLVPKSLARNSKFIPLDKVGNHLIVAMANPSDLKVIDIIRFKSGFLARPVLASLGAINRAVDKYFGAKSFDISVDNKPLDAKKNKKESRAVIEEDKQKFNSDDGPVIQLFNQLMVQCLARKASDIHIEPYEKSFRVRMRIDGSLHKVVDPPLNFQGPLTTRVKIMAGLNIAQKRLPQDGNIRVTIANKPIDFRVNTVPTVHGEKIVLRILDKSALQVDMTKLGFEKDDYDRFYESIHKPYGMVLVTGPTGSGKTTTLYSALTQLNKTSENIMTAEDPVEYNLEGINQIQMNSSIGLNFSEALRAFLRQDPDIIMVGEVRDKETGEIAIKAALTGHLVLSTLHTNSASDTVVRLQQMGLESFNLVSSLNAIVAQRLAKKICSHCKIVDETVKPEHLVQLGIHPDYAGKMVAFKGRGCSKCAQSGYLGRTAIHEVMVINDRIRDGIMKGLPAMELKNIGIETGMRTLRQNALNKLARGETDAREVVNTTTSD